MKNSSWLHNILIGMYFEYYILPNWKDFSHLGIGKIGLANFNHHTFSNAEIWNVEKR